MRCSDGGPHTFDGNADHRESGHEWLSSRKCTACEDVTQVNLYAWDGEYAYEEADGDCAFGPGHDFLGGDTGDDETGYGFDLWENCSSCPALRVRKFRHERTYVTDSSGNEIG